MARRWWTVSAAGALALAATVGAAGPASAGTTLLPPMAESRWCTAVYRVEFRSDPHLLPVKRVGVPQRVCLTPVPGGYEARYRFTEGAAPTLRFAVDCDGQRVYSGPRFTPALGQPHTERIATSLPRCELRIRNVVTGALVPWVDYLQQRDSRMSYIEL